MISNPDSDSCKPNASRMSLFEEFELGMYCSHMSPKWVPGLNKSTASGAKYARRFSNIPSPYGLCQREVDAVKTGPKLNLIKKI